MDTLAQGADNSFRVHFESLTGFPLPTRQEVSGQRVPIKEMAARAGVYFLLKGESIVYIGQSITPEARIITHTRDKDFDSFYIIRCRPEILNTAESLLIMHFKPIFNGNVTNPPQGVILKTQAKSVLKQRYGLSMTSFNKWRRLGLIDQIASHNGQEFFWTDEVIKCAEAEFRQRA